MCSYHAHVRRLRGELPVHDEVDAVGLEDVLEVGDVLRVLVAVQREARHLGPAELLEDLQVNVSENLIYCKREQKYIVVVSVKYIPVSGWLCCMAQSFDNHGQTAFLIAN